MQNFATLLENLESLQLSTTVIWIALVSLFVVLLALAREFSSWLVKTQKIRSELKEIKGQLKNIEQLLLQQRTAPPMTPPSPSKPSDSAIFPLEASIPDREITY